jgi:hypothetical protein
MYVLVKVVTLRGRVNSLMTASDDVQRSEPQEAEDCTGGWNVRHLNQSQGRTRCSSAPVAVGRYC